MITLTSSGHSCTLPRSAITGATSGTYQRLKASIEKAYETCYNTWDVKELEREVWVISIKLFLVLKGLHPYYQCNPETLVTLRPFLEDWKQFWYHNTLVINSRGQTYWQTLISLKCRSRRVVKAATDGADGTPAFLPANLTTLKFVYHLDTVAGASSAHRVMIDESHLAIGQCNAEQLKLIYGRVGAYDRVLSGIAKASFTCYYLSLQHQWIRFDKQELISYSCRLG
jgi:hypothetical protein